MRNGSEILLSWLMVKIYLLIHPRMIPIWFNRFYSCSLILSNNCCNKEQVKKFIIDNFSQYETVEDLIVAINDYICKNFKYVDKTYIQHFDFTETIKSKTGLCFDFALL